MIRYYTSILAKQLHLCQVNFQYFLNFFENFLNLPFWRQPTAWRVTRARGGCASRKGFATKSQFFFKNEFCEAKAFLPKNKNKKIKNKNKKSALQNGIFVVEYGKIGELYDR